MKRLCEAEGCKYVRLHREDDRLRGIQMVEVPDDLPSTTPVYCSIECSMYGRVERERRNDKS